MLDREYWRNFERKTGKGKTGHLTERRKTGNTDQRPESSRKWENTIYTIYTFAPVVILSVGCRLVAQ